MGYGKVTKKERLRRMAKKFPNAKYYLESGDGTRTSVIKGKPTVVGHSDDDYPKPKKKK